MARTTRLTDLAIRSAKPSSKAYRLADTAGLCLIIHPNGSKLWRYRYRLGVKQAEFAIGVYPEISLARARELLSDARRLVSQGIHPRHERQKQRMVAANHAADTFKAIGEDWYATKVGEWSETYAKQVKTILASDVYSEIGDLPIRQVTAAHIYAILRRVGSRPTRLKRDGAPTVALLIKQFCSAIFRHAIASLRADMDPAAALRGVVARPRVKHKHALNAKEIVEFRARVAQAGCSRELQIALLLLLLTFVRPGELRRAAWSEFDLERGRWDINPANVKGRRPHIVPLSKQAIELLRELRGLTGHHALVLPNLRDRRRPISATTFNRVLERMGYLGHFSAHGFRATASTLLNEAGFPSQHIELQLSHVTKDKVELAYNHAKHLLPRTLLMQCWADFVTNGHALHGS